MGAGTGQTPASGRDRPTDARVPVGSSDPPGSEQVYTIEELSDLCRISKMTIYRLINTGVLPAYRIGRSLRVTKTDWEQYLHTTRTAG